MAYFGNGFGFFLGHIFFGRCGRRQTSSHCDGNCWFLHHFFARWLHSSTHQKVYQIHDKTYVSPYGFLVTIPLYISRSKSRTTVTGQRRKMTATWQRPETRGSLHSRTLLVAVNPFHVCTTLPFCVGVGPVSSASCRPGALMISCLCTGNNRRDAIGSCQWHFDGWKYYFWKN